MNTAQLTELELMSDKQFLDFIVASDDPECVRLVDERRCEFWTDYRDALMDLQHLVLDRNTEALRKKVGELIDDSRWILAPNYGPSPLGGMLIDRLRAARRKVETAQNLVFEYEVGDKIRRLRSEVKELRKRLHLTKKQESIEYNLKTENARLYRELCTVKKEAAGLMMRVLRMRRERPPPNGREAIQIVPPFETMPQHPCIIARKVRLLKQVA